jgi:MFS family permease
MVVASRFSDRSGNRRSFVWPFLLAATVLFATSVVLGTGHYWISYVLLALAGACMYAPYGPYFALIPEFLPQSVSGAAMALVNSAGAVGGFLGAYLVGWLQGSFGNGAAFTFMAIALLLSAILMFLVRERRHATTVGNPNPHYRRRSDRVPHTQELGQVGQVGQVGQLGHGQQSRQGQETS